MDMLVFRGDILKKDTLVVILWVIPLPRMPVTTSIIIRLVEDFYKPSFATFTGKGDNPSYTYHSQVVISLETLPG